MQYVPESPLLSTLSSVPSADDILSFFLLVFFPRSPRLTFSVMISLFRGASTCNYPSHYIIMTSSNKLNIYNYLKLYITGVTVNAGNQGKHII